ncbi:hypothetical protein BpHYR1_029558 [Brachionus plicatilis]|uniref:Uncharacterized protein n=1 Tax=Brachionus plicatilis TaxID=10195 RepID=A0A3M7P584_BRAPC|nr:hypothetical protein BpHYR1_029558 [Brachionus plicatilis]
MKITYIPQLPYSLVRYCSLRIRNTTLTQAINTISPIDFNSLQNEFYQKNMFLFFSYELLRKSARR